MSAEDHRKKLDRRQVNLGPPLDGGERRRNPDRRVAHTCEVELSEEEWQAYFGTVPEQEASEATDPDAAAAPPAESEGERR